MILMDVNVLVYAHREDTKQHPAYRDWVESVLNANTPYGYSDLVLSGFVRVVTHPKVFETPSPLKVAVSFAEQIRSLPQAVCIAPGAKHWPLFLQCADEIGAQGNDIADAYHAALAIEWGCDWLTADKGFRRFKGLRVKHPLK